MYGNSSTAKAKGIDNTPSAEIKRNIETLVKNVLQPIRDAWGAPIIVTCGYRCPELNKAVGGVKSSDHLYGCASDIRTKEDTPSKNKDLFNLIVKMAKDGTIKCRQIIDEFNYNWIHISINNNYNSYRDNQILHIK